MYHSDLDSDKDGVAEPSVAVAVVDREFESEARIERIRESVCMQLFPDPQQDTSAFGCRRYTLTISRPHGGVRVRSNLAL